MLKKYYVNMSGEKKNDMMTGKKPIATGPGDGRIPVE